jgi:hypothetical protein
MYKSMAKSGVQVRADSKTKLTSIPLQKKTTEIEQAGSPITVQQKTPA